jgi:hypothetical protein
MRRLLIICSGAETSSGQGGPAVKFISTLRAFGWRFPVILPLKIPLVDDVASSFFFSTLGVISLKLRRVIDQKKRWQVEGRSPTADQSGFQRRKWRTNLNCRAVTDS